MKYFEASNSLFLLNEQQRNQFSKLEYYDYFYHLIHPDFHSLSFANFSLSDFWVYYHFEEVPIINSEHALHYLLRNFMLNEVLISSKFKRLKKTTIGSYTNSLMAAVLTVNLFMDILSELLSSIPKEESDFYMKFENSSKQLFNDRFATYEHYPKKLVLIETMIIKSMRGYLEQYEATYTERKLNVIRFMDQFTITKRELFELPVVIKE